MQPTGPSQPAQLAQLLTTHGLAASTAQAIMELINQPNSATWTPSVYQDLAAGLRMGRLTADWSDEDRSISCTICESVVVNPTGASAPRRSYQLIIDTTDYALGEPGERTQIITTPLVATLFHNLTEALESSDCACTPAILAELQRTVTTLHVESAECIRKAFNGPGTWRELSYHEISASAFSPEEQLNTLIADLEDSSARLDRTLHWRSPDQKTQVWISSGSITYDCSRDIPAYVALILGEKIPGQYHAISDAADFSLGEFERLRGIFMAADQRLRPEPRPAA